MSSNIRIPGKFFLRTRWAYFSISQNAMVSIPAHRHASANPPIPLNKSIWVRVAAFISLTSAVAICTTSPIARKSVSMRCQDRDAVNREARDAIPCNWYRIHQDRSTFRIALQRRLSFILALDESANLAPHINARSAWIDERIRNLSELSQKFVIWNAADTRGLSRVQDLWIRVAEQIGRSLLRRQWRGVLFHEKKRGERPVRARFV